MYNASYCVQESCLLIVKYTMLLFTGVRDSSGLMFTYTQTRREHDAGIMQVGHQVRFTQVIPPGAGNYSTYGTCHSSCLSREVEKEICCE